MTIQIRLLALACAGAAVAAAIRHPEIGSLHAQSVGPCGATVAGSALAAQNEPGARPPKTGPLDHDDRWSHLDSLWTHRASEMRRRSAAASTGARAVQEVGEIAVMQDEGDLVTRANPLDLGDVGLRLTPNASGGYDVSRVAYGFRSSAGNRVALADDDARQSSLPFAFAFFGRQYTDVFVNSDGNLTFGAADVASTERSVSRFLTGAPRVSPFFADLDPSSGGSIVASTEAGAFTVTWCGVPAYGGPGTATVQVSLLSDNAIEIHVSRQTTIREAVVGVSPGGTAEFRPVDLSAAGPIAGGAGAVGEQFTTASALDVVAASKKFLRAFPDEFDNLIMFTDTELLSDAFAYEVSVANAIRGINLPVFDYAREFGSRGQLQSVCNMDALEKYPDDPHRKFLGENSTLSIIGQEVGHRWLAFLLFRDHLGQRSAALLGRDNAHWSFFFDSDASVLEGNDIADLGGGSFRTVAAVQRYSLLDQYAMGLVDRTQVPPFFYVENPTNLTARLTRASSPQAGVTFSGTRRNVTIDDVIAAVGNRTPSAAESPRVYRQAFIYVVSNGGTPDGAALQKLDRIRVAWDQFFSAATDSRMRAETRLSSSRTDQEASGPR